MNKVINKRAGGNGGIPPVPHAERAWLAAFDYQCSKRARCVRRSDTRPNKNYLPLYQFAGLKLK